MVSRTVFVALLVAFLPLASATDSSLQSFIPGDYESYQHIARCQTIDRSNLETTFYTELQLQYTHIANPKASRTLLLVHGWPSLWSSWSNQILHFKANYSLLIPNLRGFGASTHPGDVQTSGNMHDMIEDLACVMKDVATMKVTCVGHDWGSQLCWEMARARPDLVEAVAGVAVPYIPANGNFTPTEELVKFLPHLGYQVYFSKETTSAVIELNADIRRSLRSVFRTVESPPPSDFLLSETDFLKTYSDFSEIPPPPFFTQEEEDYFVEQYKIQGFNYTLEFYTNPNRLTSFEIAHTQGNFTIPQPALSILPTLDPVANWVMVANFLNSTFYIPHLTTTTIPTAHWPQLEKPDELNSILETWLNTLPTGTSGRNIGPRQEL